MEEHSFDGLAKEMAGGAISRAQALKLVSAALLGAFGIVGLPSLAEAKRKKKKRHWHAGVVVLPSPLPPTPQPLPPCSLLQTGCPTVCTCQGTCLAGICISLGGGGLPLP